MKIEITKKINRMSVRDGGEVKRERRWGDLVDPNFLGCQIFGNGSFRGQYLSTYALDDST